MKAREKMTLRKMFEFYKIKPDEVLDAPLGERTGGHPVVTASGSSDLDEGTSIEISIWKVD